MDQYHSFGLMMTQAQDVQSVALWLGVCLLTSKKQEGELGGGDLWWWNWTWPQSDQFLGFSPTTHQAV